MQNLNHSQLVETMMDAEKRAALSADEERLLANAAAQQALVLAGQALAYIANAPLIPLANINKSNLFNNYASLVVSAQNSLALINQLLTVFNEHQARQEIARKEAEVLLDELVADNQANGRYDLNEMLEAVTPENRHPEVPISPVNDAAYNHNFWGDK